MEKRRKPIFIDGTHISLIRQGAGRDILFLHGYMSCKESFYHNISALAARYSVTAIDLPGFGASSPITDAWSVGDYAAFTLKFINKANLNKPFVIAHSFGARVAIKAAAGAPCPFGALIITGGAGIVKPRTPAYRRKVALYRMVKKVCPRFAERRFGSREYRALTPVMKASYKKIVNEDLLEDARKITCPTLLIYGADDKVTPFYQEGRAFNGAVKQSELKLMRGGHFCFADYPKDFNRMATDFFVNIKEG